MKCPAYNNINKNKLNKNDGNMSTEGTKKKKKAQLVNWRNKQKNVKYAKSATYFHELIYTTSNKIIPS